LRPKISNSVIRDNLRDNRLIHVNEQTLKVVNSKEFQRLRSIKQMGVASLVFPTAEHSRFSHSLGVFATALESFASLRRKAEPLSIPFPAMRFDKEAETDFTIAAMCHDIGHTAYSHVLESVLLPSGFLRHEECTLALLEDKKSEIFKAIDNFADVDAVALFIRGTHPNIALSQLISGPFDVDRTDYLIRDSLNAGVHYGTFDTRWLLHSIVVSKNHYGQPVLLLDGPRGLDSLSQFLSARRYMYRHVYLHPTIRSAQLLLKNIFQRLSDARPSKSFIDSCPPNFKSFLSGDQIPIDDFLKTTDIEVQYFVRFLSEYSDDEVLKYLSNRFCVRKFPKCVVDSAKYQQKLTKNDSLNDDSDLRLQMRLWEETSPSKLNDLRDVCVEVAEEYFRSNGMDPDIAKYCVTYEKVPFKSDASADFNFVYGNEIVQLDHIDDSDLVFNLNNLLKTFHVKRLFVPDECSQLAREKVSELLKESQSG
jgi:uncharacterized protein